MRLDLPAQRSSSVNFQAWALIVGASIAVILIVAERWNK
jgi:hypothetical protein